GNTHGLRAAPLKRLQKLTARKSPAERIIGPELARALTELAAEIQRQVGVLLDRRGHVEYVLVGDARSVYLPDLSAYRRGRDRLAGLRLVHTHFNNEPLNDDDLTDLALLRLDLVAAVGVLEDGLPGVVHYGQLLPANEDEQPWRLTTVRSVHELQDDFLESIDALEDEFARLRKPRRAGDQRDRAILVHVSQDPLSHAEDSVAELRELARSAGIDVVHEVIQRRPVDPRFVMGKGRLQATVIKAMQLGAELLVFDQDLAPTQVNALADYTDLKVLDRTQVILDIFGQRAVTREGKIQVELAQLRYLLPRLGAKQTASAFSRLTGGIGGRGPGETKLEIDRRRAQDRISALEREVEKLGERRRLRRSERNRRDVPIVSIVGYTNAGKSTLLNNLTQSEVIAENVLFATLNPVSRRLRFPREREIIITDTVGFIRNLPKDLMSAFRTTLEELDDADFLVHVLDASSQHLDDEKATVDSVLAQLHLDTKPLLLVLNKADLCNPDELNGLTTRLNGIPLCALDRSTFRPLLDAIESQLWAATQNAANGEWPHEVPTQAD
ncbi:MAG: GTPase HflX, partial [Candidatus Hydrogenedentes bacterium]|nr:GTPase HflX [Candidatus Hydrogenedentota bacterium]